MLSDPKAQTLIFLHIPKAGGTTLHRIVEQNYPAGQVYRYENPADFQKLKDEEKRRLKVISGHLHFGLHSQLSQPSTYFTMLRDPIDRVVSNYYYVLRFPAHRFHQKLTSEKMSLADYVTSKINPQLDNGQLRLLSGIQEEILFGGCSVEMFNRAMDNLKNSFSVIGVMEQFDASLRVMQKRFGWKNISYKKANVTPDRPALSEIDAKTMRVIEECNRYDLELYKFARTSLETALSVTAS